MIRFLQNVNGKNVDAQKTAKEELIRGNFIKVDQAKGEVSKAVNDGEVFGIAVRDVVVTDDVAQGLPVSDYDNEQDIIAIGEYLGIRVLEKGERVITTAFDPTLQDADVTVGKFLTVKNGLLAKPDDLTATQYQSLGWIDDAGHKTLGFVLV